MLLLKWSQNKFRVSPTEGWEIFLVVVKFSSLFGWLKGMNSWYYFASEIDQVTQLIASLEPIWHEIHLIERKASLSATHETLTEHLLRPLSLSPRGSTFSLVICDPAMKVWWRPLWLLEHSSLGIYQSPWQTPSSRVCPVVLPAHWLTNQLFTSTATFFPEFMTPYLIMSKPRSPLMPCGSHTRSVLTTVWLSFALILHLSCSVNIGRPCPPFFSLSVPVRLHLRLLLCGFCVWRPKLAKPMRRKTAVNVGLKIHPSVSATF